MAAVPPAKPRPDADPAYLAKLRGALRWDAERQEPYLQLPSHPHLRVIPYRQGLQDDMVEMFNQPTIGIRLYRLPYPYPKSKADETISECMRDDAPVLALLAEHMRSAAAEADQPIPTPSAEELEKGTFMICPFHSLFDTNLGKAVGDVGLDPHNYHFGDVKYTEAEVKAMPREKQIWDIGYVLHPSHGGKGVMTEVVGVLIESWIKPWMRIGTIGAFAEFDNPGSLSVLRKNGVEQVGSVQTIWPEEKGGGVKETGRFERKLL